MVDTEQFSLRWNNFYTNLKTGIQDLLREENFVDVTLAAEGQFLQAHKLLLSVCSPYFKALFRANPCKHPIVILNNVGFRELRDILTFIYRGEVHVSQSDLPGFLKTAELLQVKGLSGDDPDDVSSDPTEIRSEQVFKSEVPITIDDSEEPESRPSKRVTSQQPNASEQPKRPRHDVDHRIEGSEPSPVADARRVKNEPTFEIKRKPVVKQKSKEHADAKPRNVSSRRSSDDKSWSGGGVEDVDATYDSKLWARGGFKENDAKSNADPADADDRLVEDADLSSGGVFASTTASYSSDTSRDNGSKVTPAARVHRCAMCFKCFSRRDHLRTHEKNLHGEDAGPFSCTVCLQLYKNTESLRKHIAKYHHVKLDQNDAGPGADRKTAATTPYRVV